MSGGSMNYICYQVEDASRHFSNPQIRDLVKDIAKLMHDKEWADSGDYSDGAYNKTEKELCEKWFNNYPATTESIITEEINSLRNTLLNSFGFAKYCKDCKWWKQESDDYGVCNDNKWSEHGHTFACNEWSDEE